MEKLSVDNIAHNMDKMASKLKIDKIAEKTDKVAADMKEKINEVIQPTKIGKSITGFFNEVSQQAEKLTQGALNSLHTDHAKLAPSNMPNVAGPSELDHSGLQRLGDIRPDQPSKTTTPVTQPMTPVNPEPQVQVQPQHSEVVQPPQPEPIVQQQPQVVSHPVVNNEPFRQPEVAPSQEVQPVTGSSSSTAVVSHVPQITPSVPSPVVQHVEPVVVPTPSVPQHVEQPIVAPTPQSVVVPEPQPIVTPQVPIEQPQQAQPIVEPTVVQPPQQEQPQVLVHPVVTPEPVHHPQTVPELVTAVNTEPEPVQHPTAQTTDQVEEKQHDDNEHVGSDNEHVGDDEPPRQSFFSVTIGDDDDDDQPYQHDSTKSTPDSMFNVTII